MSARIILSHYQAAPLVRSRRLGEAQVRTSIDLNLTMTIAQLSDEGLTLPDGRVVPWPVIDEIAPNQSGCFLVEGDEFEKIQTFSEGTGRAVTLYPTPGAPTVLISGTPMHRIKDSNPYQDTLTKVRSIAPISGRVLDTATGLGYTACQASRSASRVVTIELDPAVSEIARLNPWSKELFESPKIERVFGDSYDVLNGFRDECFDAIIHDPPMFSLAGDLYSGEFYARLLRVLVRGGKLFHYIGDPASKSSGSVTRSVVKRLAEAGFRSVTAHPEAFGVTAVR
ncbi:MAG: methyltransferase domain-containing protein [Chloroflexota bacterium]